MRQTFDPQVRFGQTPIEEVPLNTHCRDEIIPILRALQHLYAQPSARRHPRRGGGGRQR